MMDGPLDGDFVGCGCESVLIVVVVMVFGLKVAELAWERIMNGSNC